MALCSQFSCQIGCSSAELSLDTTFNAKHFTESVPAPCFNFKGISLSPEFGLHMQITVLRCMDINSMHMIDFTQLAFKGSKLKAHFSCLTVWQNLQCMFVNWMHHRKPKVSWYNLSSFLFCL